MLTVLSPTMATTADQFEYVLSSPAYTSTPISLGINPPSVIFVKAGANGSMNGASWANAFPTLQQALATAGSCDQIWLAQGSYNPGQPWQRFLVVDERPRHLWRFCREPETNLAQRNPQTHPTILTSTNSGSMFS